MFSTSIAVSFDHKTKNSLADVPITRSTWTKPGFKDDGALHTYTMILTPSYIKLLMDGKVVQYNTN